MKGGVPPVMEWVLYIPFRQDRSQEPFLSPLGKKRRLLPTIAAPFAVTAIGGIALVVAAGALFSGMANRTGMSLAPVPAIEEAASAPVATASGPAPAASGQASVRQAAQDAASTAATPAPSQPAAPPVAVQPGLPALSFNAPAAASDDGIAVLEVIPDSFPEDEPEPVVADEMSDEPATATTQNVSARSSGPLLVPAQVNSAVNLRAAPSKNADVLGVVPANAQIDAQNDCSWCAVTYEGRSGFVYKSFIDYR